MLLGTAMAMSATTGMPAFVSGLLSMGAKELDNSKARRQEPHGRRDARGHERDQHRQAGTLTMKRDDGLDDLRGRHVVQRGRRGLPQERRDPRGRPRPGAGLRAPGARARARQRRDRLDDGKVVGDPTEAALVLLAAKLGVDAEETRRAYPRAAEVPFDSDHKFMATFHRAEPRLDPRSGPRTRARGETRRVSRITSSPAR
jgi:Ca2+-transporting ATPase